MKKLLTISKDVNIKVTSAIHDYLVADNIYLPIDPTDKLLIHSKNIKKGERTHTHQKKNYYSPVSGKVQKIEARKNARGEDAYFLNIKNDFQENDSYTGVSEFTTVKISTDFVKKVKEYPDYPWYKFRKKTKIVLNGIEDEPYIANKPFLHKYYAREILQMLDILGDVFKIPEILLCFKENDRESIETIEAFLGTYPNMSMKILPDVYPIGETSILTHYLQLDKTAAIVSSEEIFDLYREIVKDRRKDAILVTLTGDEIKNPQVVRVKIGTPLKEVVKDTIKLKSDNVRVIVNGLLKGYESKIEDIILTEDIRAIYFMTKKDYQETPCIHCGKCNEVCPTKALPYTSYLSKGQKQNKNCIQCGLCSFICPSHIPLYKYTGGSKK